MKEKKNSVYSNLTLMKYWDYERNDVDPKQVSVSERTPKRYWKCTNCGYAWMSSVEARRQSEGKCPCCDSGKAILTGYNDVLTLVPDINEVFSQVMNPDIDLSKLGIGSKKRVVWSCRECGRSWETELHSRIQYADGKYSLLKCPHFNTTKRDHGDIRYVSDMPGMMRFWDPENTSDPHTLPDNSTTNVNLLCSVCGYKWTSSPVSFFRNSMKCPACEQHRAVQPGVNDIFTVVPDLKRFYNQDDNPDVDPSKLGVGSRQVIRWKCPVCSRTWDAQVNTRIIKENGEYRVKQCRTCYLNDPSRFTPAAEVPDLVRFWDFESNTADINLTASNSETEVTWRCKKCGYSWSSSPRDRLKGSGCPCCDTGKKIMSGRNDALTKCPELSDIYEPSLNDGRDLSKTALYSDDVITWHCKTCDYTWKASVRNTAQSSCHCPNCLNRRAIPGVNSLADKRPDLMKIWSEKNDKTPYEVLCNSYYWATWHCTVCEGEFNAYVTDIVNGKECPYCADERVLPGFNSLSAQYPDLGKQWYDTEISSDRILPTSTYRGSWKCPDCSGIFQAPVKDMVLGNAQCPYCADERVLPGFNSFKAKHPDLMTTWMYTNNYAICDPDSISDECSTQVWWTCLNEESHFYAMSPHDRLMYQRRNKESCPYCKGRRRKKRHFI